jgi:multisubunit Na+/H+ antiporter MnhG subunit
VSGGWLPLLMLIVGPLGRVMNKRAFFLGALMLAIATFITHCVARGFLEEAIHRKATRISEAAKQQTPYVADPLAVQASHAWNVLTLTGVVLTVLSVVCMATAAIRRERGWYLILLLLLVFDIGLPMLL